MKKAGILTTYFAANYGAMLQPFALKRVLEQEGCKVEMIRYEQKDVSFRNNLDEKKSSIRRLEKTLNYINSHFMETVTLEQAAALSCMSPTYFSEYFHRVTSHSFRDYVTLLRL